MTLSSQVRESVGGVYLRPNDTVRADTDCESLGRELPIDRHFAQSLLAAEIGSDGDRTLLGLRWVRGGGCKTRGRDANCFEGDGGI